VDSGTGAVTIDAVSDGCTGTNNCHAFEIFGNNLAPTTITSAKASGTAISITGAAINSTSSDSLGVSTWNGSLTNFHKIAATGGGDITITGSSPSTTPNSIRFNSAYVFGKGNITIDAGSQGLAFGNNSGTFPNIIGGATAAADDTGNLTMRAGTFSFANQTTTFRNTGNVIFEPSGNSFSAAQTWPATLAALNGTNGFRFGKSTNTADVTISGAISVAGNIEVYGGAITNSAALTTSGGTITETGSTFSNSAALTTSGKDITITTDQAAVGAALTSGGTTAGIVTIGPKTTAKNIDLGAADSASLLGLTNTELGFVTAKTLRVGSATTAANINVSANISIAAAKVANFALRGTGNVTTTNSASITAANLGIAVGGTINLPGSNSITGNLALNGSGASTNFNQSSGSYTPASVDSIPANFGVVSSITVSQVPTATPQDAYMAVTFNPPPVVTLKDSYGNTLASANSLANGYTITASLNVISTTSGTMTLSGTTSKSTTTGSATFNALKVSGGTGTATITFSAAVTGDLTQAAVASAQTTGTYNVQPGDPAALVVATAAAGGKSGQAFTTQPVIHIKDAGGNLVQIAPGNSLVVTATLTSGNGTLIGTATATAVNSVATFTDLGITGSIANSYTITYTVTSNGTDISVAQTLISISYGSATQLALTTQAAGFVNAVNFTTQP
ncbi:MAG: beta strand repeat-containing protein, partial [Micrococcales bacterium]